MFLDECYELLGDFVVEVLDNRAEAWFRKLFVALFIGFYHCWDFLLFVGCSEDGVRITVIQHEYVIYASA